MDPIYTNAYSNYPMNIILYCECQLDLNFIIRINIILSGDMSKYVFIVSQ